MPDPPPEPPVWSPIEPLDGEPAPPARAIRRRELILGAGLLVGLLAFVLSQWWGQQTRQDAYRAGERAALAQDWLQARAAYAQAAGYADADQRAAEADRMAAYAPALSGTVALRGRGSDSGLYYYGARGWYFL